MLRFGSLFSGAGLLDVGFEQAGIEHAWFCESDPWRREILRNRWPGVPVRPDIRELRAGDLAPADGVVGGFPCKGVSSAGNRNGFDHPETVLWREMARVVGELRPGYVVLENVANLLTLKKGLVWQEVLETLASFGFDVVWDCIPASAVGAPHGRDRVFAVAHAQDGRWAAAADAEEPRGLGRHAGATAGAVAHADGPDEQRDAGQRRLADGRPDAGGGGQDAADAGNGGRGSNERHLRTWQPDAQGIAVEWGVYEPAVRRWEVIHGPAPEPLIRRVDDGDAKLRRVRSRVDRSRLSALGDGVQVYVARVVGEYVVWLEQQRRLQLGLDVQKERAHVTHA